MLLLPAPLTPASTEMSYGLTSSARPRLARCRYGGPPEVIGGGPEKSRDAGPGFLRLHRGDELVEATLEVAQAGAAIPRQRLEILDREDDRPRCGAPRDRDGTPGRRLVDH